MARIISGAYVILHCAGPGCIRGPDGIKGDLNQALVSLDLVLRMIVPAKWLVMMTIFCTSQVLGWVGCLRNNLYCVEWDVKRYYTIPCRCYVYYVYITQWCKPCVSDAHSICPVSALSMCLCIFRPKGAIQICYYYYYYYYFFVP